MRDKEGEREERKKEKERERERKKERKKETKKLRESVCVRKSEIEGERDECVLLICGNGLSDRMGCSVSALRHLLHSPLSIRLSVDFCRTVLGSLSYPLKYR